MVLQVHPLPYKTDLSDPELVVKGESRIAAQQENNYTIIGAASSVTCEMSMEIKASSVRMSDYISTPFMSITYLFLTGNTFLS